MGRRDVVVIGGSLGATAVLADLLSALPAELPASLFVVTHMPPKGGGAMLSLLQHRSALPVTIAREGETYRPGHVYLASAGTHLMLKGDVIEFGRGPRENMARPAIDPLFRSAAAACNSRVVAVLLSGLLSDGASGLTAIVQQGGTVIVQDPLSASAPSMPLAALAAVPQAQVATPDQMGAMLVALVGEETFSARQEVVPALELEIDIARGQRLGSAALRTIGSPVALTCPECDGVLSKLDVPGPLRYRCQTGDGFTGDLLFQEQAGALENALRVALRVVEERVELVVQLSEDATASGRGALVELYEARAREYAGYAETLRRAALSMMEGRSHELSPPDGDSSP